MNRFAYNQLLQWKNSGNSRFLILGGITGVGKTTLIKEFGDSEFNFNLYIDSSTSDIEFITKEIINLPSLSLVIIDNLNGSRDKLSDINQLSIKFPELYFIIIDSFIKEGRGDTKPLAVKYLVLFPLSFEEFLYNVNIELYKIFATLNNVNDIDINFNNKIMFYFSHYLIVGGMPSVIELYIEKGLKFDEVRQEQKYLLKNIYSNLSNYYKTTDYKNLIKVIQLIYTNLVRDNRKFKLSDISESTRFKSFKKYFTSLENLNLIYISPIIKQKDFKFNENSIITYFADVGLLGAISDIPEVLYLSDGLLSNSILSGICNNYVATELFSSGNIEIYSWIHNMSKIEFLLVRENKVSGIEVKNDSSGKLKSFESFEGYFKDSTKIRLNLTPPQKRGGTEMFPIYLIKSLYRKIISLN
ncbi:MAG: DUF4143 domain-containing protein [Spirochaetaceae bacterium]